MILEGVGPPKVHGRGPNLHGLRKVHGTQHGEAEFTGIISPTEAESNDCLKSHTYIFFVGHTAFSRGNYVFGRGCLETNNDLQFSLVRVFGPGPGDSGMES